MPGEPMLDPLLSTAQTLNLVRQASELLTLVLGLAISYIAFRGYRRNRSRPMLFVSLGFVLLVGVPVIAFLVVLAVVGVSEVTAAATGDLSFAVAAANSVGQAGELLGLVCILYGLWTPRERS